MSTWIVPLQATTLSLALLWLLLTLLRREKGPLTWTWAVFCASIALLQAKLLAGPSLAPWHYLFGLGACATCNGFWLVSRALFRPGPPFGAAHLAYAALIAALIVAAQLLALADALGAPGAGGLAAWRAALGRVLDLTSSAALTFAFIEGLRGFRAARHGERRLRLVFLSSYGGCVALTSLAPALAQGGALAAPAVPLAQAGAALWILLVTQALIHWRLRHAHRPAPACAPAGASRGGPRDLRLPPTSAAPAAAPGAPAPAAPRSLPESERDQDRALGVRLERHMREARPYLDPGLKLVHLAQALAVCEYRISRAMHGLGHRNLAHYVNGFRLRHACMLLQDPAAASWSTLVVGMESGFGSLGAFHRAFRARHGCTPGEFRQAAGALMACPAAPAPPCP